MSWNDLKDTLGKISILIPRNLFNLPFSENNFLLLSLFVLSWSTCFMLWPLIPEGRSFTARLSFLGWVNAFMKFGLEGRNSSCKFSTVRAFYSLVLRSLVPLCERIKTLEFSQRRRFEGILHSTFFSSKENVGNLIFPAMVLEKTRNLCFKRMEFSECKFSKTLCDDIKGRNFKVRFKYLFVFIPRHKILFLVFRKHRERVQLLLLFR